MSDLLQQAIIDATALKEAAIKNAENTLVEKYSQEFKETVQKLLEQEQAAAPTDAAAATPPTDPAAVAAPMPTPASADASAPGGEKKDAFKKVKTAFLDGPDDELITINFDQIKSTMMEMLGQEEIVEEEYDRREPKSDTTNDALKAGAPKKDDEKLEEESYQEEYELDEALYGDEPVEDELEEGSTYSGDGEGKETLEEVELIEMEDPSAAGAQEKADAARLTKQAADKEAQAAAKEAAATKEKQAEEEAAASQTTTAMAESIEISEEELTELAEELRVDLQPENQGRGYMGSTKTEKEKLRNIEYAAARDDKAVKAREEELKRLQDLVQENKNLKNLNNKMMSMLETLKGEVEKINVSNAKLLYTNKALGNISLNERQKNAIVESISKADSVLKAKTIYETLQSAVETTSIQKEAPQSLRETLNRAQSPFVVKKSTANSINDVMAERMKALAGIKIK